MWEITSHLKWLNNNFAKHFKLKKYLQEIYFTFRDDIFNDFLPILRQHKL